MFLKDKAVIHCLFEQSGTYKNQFKRFGFTAYDYDILNDFNETDFVIDIFNEINNAYDNKDSIFDNITNNDLVFAFFPCVRFENQILLHFRGDAKQLQKLPIIDLLYNDIKLQSELNYLYNLINRLVIVCLRKGLRLIIENPYSTNSYLITHWALKPSLIDYDRSERGDYFVKPTAYWFVNCTPSDNFIFESSNINRTNRIVSTSDKVTRSLMSSDYANRFIREFIF